MTPESAKNHNYRMRNVFSNVSPGKNIFFNIFKSEYKIIYYYLEI